MRRRDFLRTCAIGGASALAFESLAKNAAALSAKAYARAQLIGPTGGPFKASALAPNRAYVFHYPFAATPCFLLNLGQPVRSGHDLRTADARSYRWEGGVGPQQSIVAYSAICSHRLTYPTREISFIGYREERTAQSNHARVIHCCSEHSQYDPAAGGRVLAGPAPQPLAAILLEYDRAADSLSATGTLGGELFNDFFARFEMRLALEHGGKARSAVAGQTAVQELTTYCRQQVKC